MRTGEDKAPEQLCSKAVPRVDHDPVGDRPLAAAMAGSSRVLGPAAMISLQRLVGNAAVARLARPSPSGAEQPSPVRDVVGKGGGQPLDPATRAPMEAGLGQDLSDVRVHTGPKAMASARAVAATAYTVGNEVVLAGGYDPSSPLTQRTLAHELTHVIQQRRGPVDGTPAPGGIRLCDPSDRFEREAQRTAESITPAPSAPSANGSASQPSTFSPQHRPTVQRLLTRLDNSLGGSTPTTNWGQVAAAVDVYNAADKARRSVISRRDLLDQVEHLLGQGKALNTGFRGFRHRGARKTKRDAAQALKAEIAAEAHALGAESEALKETFDAIGDDIWRQYIDLRRQHLGSAVFDRGLHGKPPEAGYLSSMAAAHSLARDQLGKKMDATEYESIQGASRQHSDDDDMAGWSASTDRVKAEKATAGDEFMRVANDALGTPNLGSAERNKKLKDAGISYGDLIESIYYTPDTAVIQFAFKYQGKSEAASKQRIDDMFKAFYSEMQTSDQPLKAIARLHKNLEYMHPFKDANTRTNLVVLNKILVEHNFTPVILDDPNMSYTRTVDEWEALLQKGMERWLEVSAARQFGHDPEAALAAFDASTPGFGDRKFANRPSGVGAQDLDGNDAVDFTA